ncbi:hypothetical protein CDO73_06780 [Saccharibacillus sp. O23]|uniref:hypothetical protein n=1 Tax=Saccharibacillus sp. O23 TaxID=2009338 RepID=UPI000B4E10D3|nr:hypothetical protein [Saccharibacillus sp. O23]OWR31430.1 hypothetical protein CDO73_06780 [Saccharibacillus sp. O23]
MHLWLRLLIIIVLLFSASSFLWFLLGSTAYFQRGMDIIGTSVFWSLAVPVLFLVGVFTIILIKGWNVTSGGQYAVVFIGLLISLILSTSLMQSVSTYGWDKEKIKSDSIQVTADNKFEYRIDLINLFQRNSSAMLYLKDIGTGEERYIPVDIQTSEIVGLGVKRFNHWIMLEPTNTKAQYILYTTKELGIPEERFRIEILSGTSSRLN